MNNIVKENLQSIKIQFHNRNPDQVTFFDRDTLP